ncbi:Zinc finger protein 26 [Frankliniella fusca]|uniref:Zinc finger protein 26 n=1 Tax=Frankliniella fusca TaxID=407009 RepID=A0AAE1H5W9_9NEOP|nr:Zinc finger protein 26 [Frankliniella fusca]
MVKEGDGLPVVICHRCLFYIDTFVDFRLRCQRVDAALHIFCNEIKAKDNRYESVSKESHPVECVESSSQEESLKSSDSAFTVSDSESLEKSKGSHLNVKVNEFCDCETDSKSPLSESEMSSKDSRMGPSNKPYHCPHCNKPFTYKARLAAHIKTHGENQVYQPDNMLQMQQQPLPQPPQASQHSLHHSAQQQSMQSQSLQAQGIQSPQLQHQLSPSGNHYSSQQHTLPYAMPQSPLPQHMQQQTSVPQQYLSQQSISGSESSYNCSSCSASFMTPWMLADHVRSRCCDPNVSYNCEKCYSQFGSFVDLEQHKLSRSCENQVPSYYDAYTPPPSHYGMYSQQHQQDFSSGSDMIDSRNTPSPWNVMASRSPGAIGNGNNSRTRMQRQDNYSTRSPQLGTMEELEKFAMSNTVVTSPLEPLASPGLTEPLASAPSPLDPENSVQSVQSVQSTQSTQSSGSGSCGPRSNSNFNNTSGVRFGGPNFCGGNINSNYGSSNTNSAFMSGSGQGFGNMNQNFGNSSPNQGFGSNIMMQNSPFGSNGNCAMDQSLNSNVTGNSQSMNFVEESNLSFGNSLSSTYSKKSSSGCSSPQDSRLEVNANTKFCDDMNPHALDQKGSPLAERMGSPLIDGDSKSRIKVNESLNINISDSVTGSCSEMLLTTSPGSSKGCMGGGDNPYSCQVCKASFASRTLFSNHMKTHAPDRSLKCNLCNNSFPTTAALRSHVDSVHSESGSEKSLHIVLDDSQSPGKMNENGNSDDSDDEPLSKLVVKPTPPPVKRRGRKPKSETENGEKPYGCVYCGKGFVTAVRLAIHTKLHTAEKPFKCDQCDKAFRSRAHLQRHVKTHAGDKPFKCVTCSKSFTVSMNLKIHMRTHTGERPYQCNLCKMAFIGYSHLYNHLKTHSDTQGPFTYTYFNKVYTTTGNFTLTKREKTARGRNREKDVENDPTKEDEEIEQVKEVVRTINKSTTGKKRGRKAHFYEPEEEEEDVLDDDDDGGIETSDGALDFK